MAETSGSGARVQMMQQQADVVISQDNPVSATLYEVLPTTKNVRIIGMNIQIIWATTQPTPLEIVATIDGQSVVYLQANPVTATFYSAVINETSAIQSFAAATGEVHRSFLLEGRSVRVQVRVTWAVTQPTPLVCRVKYAKIP